MKSRKIANPTAFAGRRERESPDQRFLVYAAMPGRSVFEQVVDWATRHEDGPQDVYIRWKFSKEDLPNRSFVLETNSSIHLLQLCNILFRNGLNPTVYDTSATLHTRTNRVLDEENNNELYRRVPLEHSNQSFTHLTTNSHGRPTLPKGSTLAYPCRTDGYKARHRVQTSVTAFGRDKYLQSMDTAQTFGGSASQVSRVGKVAALVKNGKYIMVELNHAPSNLKINVQDHFPNQMASFQSPQNSTPEATLQSSASLGRAQASPATTPQTAAEKKKKISCVLYVKGFDQRTTSLEQLTRVFQCFGAIENALLHTKKEYALVKFANARGAKTCIKELYGKEIAGRKLLIHYSEYEELTNRYFTNEKCYYQPNKALRAVADMPPASALSKQVILCILPLPTQSAPQLTLDELVKAVHLPRHAAILNPCKEIVSELRLEFPSILTVIDFAQEFNYREFESWGFFTALTFVHP